MKIVIDMTEEDYNNIEPFLNGETIKGGFNLVKVLEIIKNGTPLPKGHGDLKDYDAIKSDYIRKMSVFMNEEERMDLLCTIVDEAPTIIEADKENT